MEFVLELIRVLRWPLVMVMIGLIIGYTGRRRSKMARLRRKHSEELREMIRRLRRCVQEGCNCSDCVRCREEIHWLEQVLEQVLKLWQ